jgi:hypothetical protein
MEHPGSRRLPEGNLAAHHAQPARAARRTGGQGHDVQDDAARDLVHRDSRWNTQGPGAFPKEIWPRITLSLRELLAAPAGKVMTFKMTPLAISSTAIRETTASGGSIRYLTPDPVVEFIRSHELYLPPQEAAVPDIAQ